MKKADFLVAEGVAALKNHRETENRLEELILRCLCDTFNNDFSGCEIKDIFIADDAKGTPVEDGVWEELGFDFKHDTRTGTRYYPIENSEKYIAVSYSF